MALVTRNTAPPTSLIAEHLARVFGTEEDPVNCAFYFKVGTCRHGDMCSKRHNRPTSSRTLLLSHLYPNPPEALAIAGEENWDDDQYDRAQAHVEAFYTEVVLVLAEYGEIEEVVVVDNTVDYMVGNVYVRFYHESDAERALSGLTGRLYFGKLISAEYSPVTDVREARCRAFHETRCSRGGSCRFLHIKHIPVAIKRRVAQEMYRQHPDFRVSVKSSKRDRSCSRSGPRRRDRDSRSRHRRRRRDGSRGRVEALTDGSRPMAIADAPVRLSPRREEVRESRAEPRDREPRDRSGDRDEKVCESKTDPGEEVSERPISFSDQLRVRRIDRGDRHPSPNQKPRRGKPGEEGGHASHDQDSKASPQDTVVRSRSGRARRDPYMIVNQEDPQEPDPAHEDRGAAPGSSGRDRNLARAGRDEKNGGPARERDPKRRRFRERRDGSPPAHEEAPDKRHTIVLE